LVNAIYSNLALDYANQIGKLQTITKKPLHQLNIVGGGSNIAYLNQLTSNLAQIKVIAGPGEATALGNILVQMISTKEVADLAAGRALVQQSFALKTYLPETDYPGVLASYQQMLNQEEH